MPRPGSKRLVIDASVASASGGKDADSETSTRCRDFLFAVQKICHQFVMSAEIEREWDEHQSRFARKWRTSMTRRNKCHQLEKRPEREPYKSVRTAIDKAAKRASDGKAMQKDFHLLMAAIETDRRIISLDETVRKLFGSIVGQISNLERLVWVNPKNDHEDAMGWLKGGAKLDNKRCLGT